MGTKILALTGKGGVGKTSLSAIIVKILSENFKDKKILAIDADPAIGLSTALGVDVKLTLDDIRSEIINTVEGGDTKTALELVSKSRYKISEAIVEKDNFAPYQPIFLSVHHSGQGWQTPCRIYLAPSACGL